MITSKSCTYNFLDCNKVVLYLQVFSICSKVGEAALL